MKIIYGNNKVEKSLTDKNYSQKKHGQRLSVQLLKAEKIIARSKNIQDIINYQPFLFHNLKGNRKGEFSIVPLKSSPYRIILEPLDEKKQKFNPCEIHKIVNDVCYIKIKGVEDYHD